MQRTLITFLGIGPYSETTYQWQGVGEFKTPYVAVALGKLWNAASIVVLATQAAEDKNGDRLRQHLKTAGVPEATFKRLPDGRTELELWDQFQAMREAVTAAVDAEVIVDITHGFRAQSFFAGAVLSVLRASGLKLNHLTLVYGEFRQHESVSPVWDLTLFVELLDWAQALSLFLKTGVAAPVVELGRQMQRREAEKALASNRQNFPTFGPLVKAIEQFADDLATIRVAAIVTGYEQQDSKKVKARGSASVLLDAIGQCRKEVLAKLPALALILDELAESVRPLSAARLHGESGQRAQYALARRYLALSRYPEAAVVTREARISWFAGDERAVEVNSPDFDDTRRGLADNRFGEQEEAREIGGIRNDIEHGGFRKQPLSAKALQKGVEQLVERFAPVPADQVNVPARDSNLPAGRTFFITRHPGAVEWAARQGVAVDRTVAHLDPAEIHAGDVVIGTLPVHLAAQVCARGARYLHLVLDLPRERRGLELTAGDMMRYRARLEEYRVERTQ
jgi:CRISPR-associated protein Csx16